MGFHVSQSQSIAMIGAIGPAISCHPCGDDDVGCMEMVEIGCPTCGEWFAVAEPAAAELPCRVDYDCEICCRPMVVVFEGGGQAWASGIGE